MKDQEVQKMLLDKLGELTTAGFPVVIVHGGGPFIKKALEDAGISSEFIAGHRKTSPEALEHVEMALKGKVNGQVVALLNSMGYPAVGLSGKDGNLVIAEKRYHLEQVNGTVQKVDLGQVGNVKTVNPTILNLLLEHNFIPVVTCLAADEQGITYNINGDTFAGHLAGALQAKEFVVLTDVDGLMRDIRDPESLIPELSLDEIDHMTSQGIIKGGMIPKIEACKHALEQGAQSVRIMNGMKPDQFSALSRQEPVGTLITR